ncbi:Rpn family recombination-promoting nuclease/putative transposase [Clostridium massiliamazoniense]|uniref:Rpn family recombination-promoting nuclease/putative transposase n=1 Tax=Clostridium massiliamazoniense TaxID=1347366 RepID=UPI0006D78E11|nr:Rpn family recombination-promoting nuclease/putative transposase [Clostridium massiliamazoniense]
MGLLSPKMDFIFQQIFGSEENKEISISFLNAVLNSTEKNKIEKVIFKKSYVIDEYSSDKFRLNIEATTNKNEIINIEVQVRYEQSLIQKTLYFWNKLYSKQLEEGQNYGVLNKTIYINVLNFNYLKETSNFHSVFRLKEITSNMELTDIEEIHFIELPKFVNNKEKSLLAAWCEFLNNPNSVEVRELENEVDEIKRAMDILIRISNNEEQRRFYEIKEKQILDEISALALAKQRSIESFLEIGKEEGRKQIAIKIAKNLLDILDDETIALKTGLTIEEIKKLR